ncbi:hypothetical protein N9933_01045 [bacterium]|nr:hypothetical protein [bacterium]
MIVNEELKSVLKGADVSFDNALLYLLSLYHELNPTCIPNEVKIKVHALNIVAMSTHGLVWYVPLFETQSTDYGWVENEYLALFEPYGTHKQHKVECLKRMKKFFYEYFGTYNKEQVLGATKLYVQNGVRTGGYIRLPHYFITKGRGDNRIQDIITWIDVYNLENKQVTRTSLATTMQDDNT